MDVMVFPLAVPGPLPAFPRALLQDQRAGAPPWGGGRLLRRTARRVALEHRPRRHRRQST
jgi:hypothetical protein